MNDFKEYVYSIGKVSYQVSSFYYINEQIEEYKKYNVGDIVLVSDFKYDDGYEGTNQLFVLIDRELAIPLEYMSYMLDKKNMIPKKEMKIDSVYKLLNEQIRYKIGVIDYEKISKYMEEYIKMNKNINY